MKTPIWYCRRSGACRPPNMKICRVKTLQLYDNIYIYMDGILANVLLVDPQK